MEFKFLPIVVAVITIKFGTVAADAHNDCYNYDAKAPNGKLIRDIFRDCGITEVKTFNNPKLFKCIEEEFQVLNEDGTFKGEKMKSLMKQYANPEYNDKIQHMVDEVLKQPPENFYTVYPKELANVVLSSAIKTQAFRKHPRVTEIIEIDSRRGLWNMDRAQNFVVQLLDLYDYCLGEMRTNVVVQQENSTNINKNFDVRFVLTTNSIETLEDAEKT